MVALTRIGTAGWTRNHNSSAAAIASCVNSAVSGSRHICTGLSASITASVSASGPEVVQLKDGVNVLWEKTLHAPIGGTASIVVKNLNKEGLRNNRMSLAFVSGGATPSIESVSMWGYDINDMSTYSFTPSEEEGLAAWYAFNEGITVSGAGVSVWADQSGNNRHLLQGTDTNRPAKQGDGSILFDGVDNKLKADAFTLNQPNSIYLLVKNVTWVTGEYMYDGNTQNTGFVRDFLSGGASPQLEAYTGVSSPKNSDLPVGQYGVVAVVRDNPNHSFQINNNNPVTWSTGTANMGGFVLGANGGAGGFGNIQVKEVIIYSVAHDAATRKKVVDYLGRKI